jgi:hypothetical protein
MVFCCGAEQSSNYCPNCGLDLRQNSPLHTLLDHCRKRLVVTRGRARGPRAVQRWQSWVSALEHQLELGPTQPTQTSPNGPPKQRKKRKQPVAAVHEEPPPPPEYPPSEEPLDL